MKITPLEIRQHEFEKTFRGYNIEEVDVFLATLSQEWERVLNDSKMLRMQLEIAEKEAKKLREIEMTLFKTLKTAEDTGTMITEQANQQADKYIEDAKLEGDKLLFHAQQKAADIIKQAEEKAKYIKEDVLGGVKILERDFRAMEHYKSNLIVQMRSISSTTLEHVQRFEEKFNKESVDMKFREATSILSEEDDEIAATALIGEIRSETTISVEENTEKALEMNEKTTVIEHPQPSLIYEPIIEEPNAVHDLSLPDNLPKQPIIIQETVANNQQIQKIDDLLIIEGIDPKVSRLLHGSGIFTFRDLATTPVYKIQEILDTGGSEFTRHDPSTWTKQAKIAAEERWDDLEILKLELVGGKEPEQKNIQSISELPIEEVSIAEDSLKEEPTLKVDTLEKSVASSFPIIRQAPVIPLENNLDSVTEEMLEKVNKVKAAIRKAMVEKNDAPAKDNSPLPTLNDVIAKNESSSGGSFFDNI